MNYRCASKCLVILCLAASSAWASDNTHNFEALYKRAESRSPRILEFTEYLNASDAEISEAKAGFLPQITLTGSSRVNQYGANAYNGSVPSPAYAVGVSSWNLYDGGKTTNNVAARQFSRDAASQRLELARAELAREVADTLIESKRLALHRDAYERLHKQTQELSKAIQSQIDIDQGRRSELFSLNTKMLQISVQEADLTRREFDLKVRIEKLFGEISIRNIALPVFEDIVVAEEVPRLDTNRVPTLIAIRAEAESAKSAVKTVSAQNYPSINWIVQKSTQKDILDRDTPIYTAITFSLDVFKGFGISNAERSAASRAGGAQSRYDHAHREFLGQLRSWGAQIGMLDSQVKKLSVIENDALRLLEVVYRRYELARAVHSELIDAELSYYSTRVSHANSRAERDQLYTRIITEGGLHRRLIGER